MKLIEIYIFTTSFISFIIQTVLHAPRMPSPLNFYLRFKITTNEKKDEQNSDARGIFIDTRPNNA